MEHPQISEEKSKVTGIFSLVETSDFFRRSNNEIRVHFKPANSLSRFEAVLLSKYPTVSEVVEALLLLASNLKEFK